MFMARHMFLCSAGLLLAGFVSLTAQEGKFSARELFYGAGRKVAPAPNPSGSQATKTAKSGTPASQGTNSATDKAATGTAGRPLPEAPAPAAINVAYTPLGLRYSLLKRTGAGQYEETDIDSTFRSGDGIRVSIESNDDAYLYLVNKGSSGSWNVLFPSSQIDNGNNHVQARRRHELPAGGQFTFENPPGEERLFIVLSREPEPDLERLIYSLSGPGPKPNSSDQPKILSVKLINDDLIGRLRKAVAARDLVFEKVDDRTHDQTPSRPEKAAYVVNASASLGGRVVADLSLKHR